MSPGISPKHNFFKDRDMGNSSMKLGMVSSKSREMDGGRVGGLHKEQKETTPISKQYIIKYFVKLVMAY